MKQWHALNASELEQELATNLASGLSLAEAELRLGRFGPNSLPKPLRISSVRRFLNQFRSPLIYILLVAGVVVFATGERLDGLIILVVLILNSIIGAHQEGRAENTLAALEKFSQTSATVRRGGREYIIADREVVPGDILILRSGEKVSADARLVETHALRADESSLTGESRPVEKSETILPAGDRPPAEEGNVVFRGTNVVGGYGVAIVFSTGRDTAIGQIAQSVSGTNTEVPLHEDLRKFSKNIVGAVIFLSILIFILGLVRGLPLRLAFATVVSLAVSIIPEGLPIALTLVLATGVWRMAKRNALVKKLQAVEALGEAKVIAVDKTGTLTENQLVVRGLWINGSEYAVGGSGYDPRGDISLAGSTTDPLSHSDIMLAGKIATYCADAQVVFDEQNKTWRVSGDPTEAALLTFGAKIGFRKEELDRDAPILAEAPFDYRSKMHVTLREEGASHFLTAVGAPEMIIDSSARIVSGKETAPLDNAGRKHLESIYHNFSNKGFRVVAFGYRELHHDEKIEKITATPEHIIFAGFFCMEDSLRPEVPAAIEAAKNAGVRVVMLTGDHPLTAVAIAKEAGLHRECQKIITGPELDSFSPEKLAEEIECVSIFARITPEHKKKIIQAYRTRGEVVAMTGDGINDAPSLAAADLGVAMGRVGTEVAKEAADIVLLDDNFGTIVAAIEEGRAIYETIRKVVLYLFSTSIGEVGVVAGALLLGYPLPLLPSQIIWLNLVTDGFFAVALPFEPAETGLLNPARRAASKLIDKQMVPRMVVMGLTMAAGSLYLLRELLSVPSEHYWTIAVTVLAVVQWLNAWNCRSERESIFSRNPFSNPYLIAATIISAGLHLLAMYWYPLQHILRLTPLAPLEWLAIFSVAISVIAVDELWKAARQFRFRPHVPIEVGLVRR